MFNTNCYGNESIPSYSQGVETPWPSHATHSNQNLFHQHGVASNPNAFVGYGLGQVQSKELDLAGVVGMKETSGATSTPSATTSAWHHDHRMRYSSTAVASRGFLPYQMSSLPHYDSQSVGTSHLTHGTHHQFWMTNPNAYSLMQNYNQRDHNTYAERADHTRSTGATRHNATMQNRTYAVEDQSRNVNATLQQQPTEALPQHCQRPSRQTIHQLQQHQQIRHQQEYLRNPMTQRERDPCQYTNSGYHQESMRVGMDTSLYHEQHVMPSAQHQHPQYQASQEALRKAETERRAAFTSRQAWPQTWTKAPTYVPFDTSQAFLSNHRSSGSAFQPCSKQAGTDPYSMDSIWAKSAVPTPSSHVPHATNHTIPTTNNHIPLPAQSWMHDTTSHLKSNVYRSPQDMNKVTNAPSNFSTNVLNLDTGQVELSMSVVPPDLSIYTQTVPQTQRHRTPTAHPASVPVHSNHRSLQTPAVSQNHVKTVLKEAPAKPMESSNPTSTARASGLDVRQFLATWVEDLDIATPRPTIIESDEPEPPEPASTSLVVLDYQAVPSEEAAGLLQMCVGLQLSGNDSVVLLDGTPAKTNLDFVLSRAVPTTTSSGAVTAPASDVQVNQSSSAIDFAQSPASETPAASTSDPEKLLNSNHLEASPCDANKSSNVRENQVDLSSQPQSQEALTPLSVCESDSEKQKKISLRHFRKRKAISGESDASSQCSEQADEVSAKCMKSDNSLSNLLGNDSMDTIDGPIRTPVSVSSATYDHSSSAAQSPIDSMAPVEEQPAEDSATPESTAVPVITMNHGAKDRIGRSMPDIFDEVMYGVDQAPSESLEDCRDDSGLLGKAEVVVNIVGGQCSDERDQGSLENAVDLDRIPCHNIYKELSDGIQKSSPETDAENPVAEFESREVQQPSEILEGKGGSNSSLTANKTDLETTFSDQEFPRNTDQEISGKFELHPGDNKAGNTCQEPQHSDQISQLKASKTLDTEATCTTDQKRLHSAEKCIMHRSPTESENQNLNEGVWDITREEPSHNREKPAQIGEPWKIGKGDSLNFIRGDSKNENFLDLFNQDPSDFVDSESVDVIHRVSGDCPSSKRSDFPSQGPSDYTSREPCGYTRRELSGLTSKESSDLTSGEPSGFRGREPSSWTSRELSSCTSRDLSSCRSRELNDCTSWELGDCTSWEPSGCTSRERSDCLSWEPGNCTNRESSDSTNREACNFRSPEPSDITDREYSDTTRADLSNSVCEEPSTFTRRKSCDTTSGKLCDLSRQETEKVTMPEPDDLSDRKPDDFVDWYPNCLNNHAPTDSGNLAHNSGSQERNESDGLESIKSGDHEHSKSDHLVSIEPSCVTSRDSFSDWKAIDLDTHDDKVNHEPNDAHNLEHVDLVNKVPNDSVNLEHGDLVNQERNNSSGEISIINSMTSSADISFDLVGEDPSSVTALKVQNPASNQNEPPPNTAVITISDTQFNEDVPVGKYASSKQSPEGSQKTTQYLSRIVGSAPGKIPKILLSRLKNVRDKKRRNGVVPKLPSIRLTRVQTGTSMSVDDPPEYVCREGDSRCKGVDGHQSVSDTPNHEMRVSEKQNINSPVGQCFNLEVESSCKERSRTESRSDSPISYEAVEFRETPTRSPEKLPSPERMSPFERLRAWEYVEEPPRDDDSFSSHCNEPRSDDLTTAFSNASEPNCIDLTVSQANKLWDTDVISRPTTPISPFEKKMSSGQLFRNKSPDVADRSIDDSFRRWPVRRRFAPKRRSSLPSPKSFDEDTTFDSPLHSSSYQSESKVFSRTFKYTLAPVRMRSISVDAVESKISGMRLETKEDSDRSNDKEMKVQEGTERMSSSWEEDSRDMFVPEPCEDVQGVQKVAEKIDAHKSPVHSFSNALKFRGLEKDYARQNLDSSPVSSVQRSRKDSPAGFDSPWKSNSIKRDSPSSDEDYSSDSSDTSSTSSPKSSRSSSSSESDSSDSESSSDESPDDEKHMASSEKEDISRAEEEKVASTGKEDIANARNEDIASAGNEDIASALSEDSANAGSKAIASAGTEDVASAGNEDIASPENVDMTSSGNEDITIAGNEDTTSAREERYTTAGKEDCTIDKINDSIIWPTADGLVPEVDVTDTFASENEVQMKGSSLLDPSSDDLGVSTCGGICDAYVGDFSGDQVLRTMESLSVSAIWSSHSIEPRAKANADDHGKSGLSQISDSLNDHAAADDHVFKEAHASENASLMSATCLEGATVNNAAREDDTCPDLEPIDTERPLTSESTEMPCLEKIIEPEGSSDHNVKTDFPKILNHIDEIDGTGVLVDEDTLLVFTDGVENVFLEGEEGCVQVEVQGENADFHTAVRDVNAGVQDENAQEAEDECAGGVPVSDQDQNVREFSGEAQDENAGEFPVEVQDKRAEDFRVRVQDENVGEFPEVPDETAGEFPVEVQCEGAEDFPVSHFHDGRTEEFHIVINEEQYNGLCNGTMEVFTSDSMKTFTVKNIEEESHCEEVVSEAEHPDQGDFYCDEIDSAPVEEVVNSETTCDIEGGKVYGSCREGDAPTLFESVDIESLVGEGTSERRETGSSCNEVPLEMKCSLSWDRILNEGQGLVLGPANVEVRVPGESTKETTHWKVVTRERNRPGTSKSVEENNNVMLDVKSPIIVVKRLVLKRPRTRRTQRKREEDVLGGLWKKSAKILPPLKTKGALKAFQAQTEGTPLRNRNRSWPAASGDTTWKRHSLKRRRSDLSPPARTVSCSSPQRLPKVIIKKTGPQYQSFICDDDVFMQPVVAIERNAELDNLALTMWSVGSSPTLSVGLSPQHDCSVQTKDMAIDNGNPVYRERRKQPKTGRAGQLMKVVELLQQWRQAEQEAASKVSEDSLPSDCGDSIENNNSLMCIDNNADIDRYLHRYHSSNSSSSQGDSVTNDFSHDGNAAGKELNGETNWRRDSNDEDGVYVQEHKLHELTDSVGTEDEPLDDAVMLEPHDNTKHLGDVGEQCNAQKDNSVGSTLSEDNVSKDYSVEDNLSTKENTAEECISEDTCVVDNVHEDKVVEEIVAENNTGEGSLHDDNVVKAVQYDSIEDEDLQGSATQDFLQVENTNRQVQKQMFDVVAQTDDISEDAILGDDIVKDIVTDESAAHDVTVANAPDESIVKEDLSDNGLVEKIVEDVVQEYDSIGKFGISSLQEADSVLQDKTIREADSAYEAATAQVTASALQEVVVVREADSVLQEDVYQHDLQKGGDVSRTDKVTEGNTLSPEQSRRTSIEEELDLPLVCQVCGFTTTRLEEQANHIRTHSYHCQRCQLAFMSQVGFKDHLAAEHPTIEELHHCLLCQRTFPTAERHAQHKKGWHHSQMERSQRHTIHSLYRFFTGNDCPFLPSLSPEEVKAFDWLPSDPGVIHFYHDATPLQLAVQDCGGAKDDTETC